MGLSIQRGRYYLKLPEYNRVAASLSSRVTLATARETSSRPPVSGTELFRSSPHLTTIVKDRNIHRIGGYWAPYPGLAQRMPPSLTIRTQVQEFLLAAGLSRESRLICPRWSSSWLRHNGEIIRQIKCTNRTGSTYARSPARITLLRFHTVLIRSSSHTSTKSITNFA